jgi:hypothetical protein
MATCRSCGAAVRWVVTTTGKTMPMDAEPVENGNLVIVGEGKTRHGDMVPKVQHRDPGELSMLETERFVSHFATCPDAPEWKR